jgi:hypothetical protein
LLICRQVRSGQVRSGTQQEPVAGCPGAGATASTQPPSGKLVSQHSSSLLKPDIPIILHMELLLSTSLHFREGQ